MDSVEVKIDPSIVPTRSKDDRHPQTREVPGALTDPMLAVTNEWLKILGIDDGGRPHWRLTLTNQLEKRFGEFATFYGDILIKVEKEVAELPKYSWIHDPRWVLERLYFPTPGQIAHADVEIEGVRNGIYEPYYVFDLIEGQPVMPPLKAIQLLLKLALLGTKRTASDWEAQDEKEQEEEVEMLKTILHDDRPLMAMQFHEGEAVLNAGTESQMKKEAE